MEEEVEEKQSTCNNYMDVLNDYFQLLTACALFFCCLYDFLFFVVVFVLFFFSNSNLWI